MIDQENRVGAARSTVHLGGLRDRSDVTSRTSRQQILYISFNFPPKVGGIESVVFRTCQALSTRFQVTALAQAPGCDIDRSIAVLRPRREGLLSYLRFLYSRGRQLCRNGRFDAVVSGSALTSLPSALLARRCRARTVQVVHGLDVVYPSPLYQLFVRYALPRMDLVVANSRATREEAVARGVRRDRTAIIHPGCDPSPFLRADPSLVEELRSRWRLNEHRVILSPGRIVRRKGIDRFVSECLASVIEAVPRAKLLVAGGDPRGALVHARGAESAVLRAADAAGLRERVIVTGRLADAEMAAAFHLADVVILPAVRVKGDMEGFGIVCLEAASAGKPVVAARLGGIPDAVAEGETGVLVPPGDSQAMTGSVVRLLHDQRLAEKLGARGRQRVLQEFAWDAVGNRFCDAVAEVLAQQNLRLPGGADG